jgi:mannose-6-phosphate isomerase-like protein (cupin superfamily)
MKTMFKSLPLVAALALTQPAVAQQAAPASSPAPAAAAPPPAGPATEPRDKGTYITREQMQAIAASVVDKTTGKPGAYSKRLIAYSTHSTAFIRLMKPESPHAHGAWSELFVVTDGEGVLETGGTITGITGHDSATHKDLFLDPKQAAPDPARAARNNTPGDLAGTDVTGGYRQHVKPGDIILTPALVSHRWVAY